MALRQFLKYRGTIRAEQRRTIHHLNALTSYNSKHPLDGLLDVGTLASLIILREALTSNLAQKILR